MSTKQRYLDSYFFLRKLLIPFDILNDVLKLLQGMSLIANLLFSFIFNAFKIKSMHYFVSLAIIWLS